MKSYFEFIGSDGKTDVDHSKFWEVWIDGTSLRTRYGKIGATGQTTVKGFDSVSDAETALTKAVAEKTKKGYIEKNNTVREEPNSALEVADKFADDPSVVENRAIFKKWAENFQPVAYISFELEEIPEGISEEFIWSEIDMYQYSYLSRGFTPGEPAFAYVVTSIASTSSDSGKDITTEETIYCDDCEGSGEIDDQPCEECDGEGRFHVDLTEGYPIVITTPEELTAFIEARNDAPEEQKAETLAPAIKFCSECGTKRELPSAKFCAECGHAFG